MCLQAQCLTVRIFYLCFKLMQKKRIYTRRRVCEIACPQALAGWNSCSAARAGDDPIRDAQLGSHQPGLQTPLPLSQTEKKDYIGEMIKSGGVKYFSTLYLQPMSCVWDAIIRSVNFSSTGKDQLEAQFYCRLCCVRTSGKLFWVDFYIQMEKMIIAILTSGLF